MIKKDDIVMVQAVVKQVANRGEGVKPLIKIGLKAGTTENKYGDMEMYIDPDYIKDFNRPDQVFIATPLKFTNCKAIYCKTDQTNIVVDVLRHSKVIFNTDGKFTVHYDIRVNGIDKIIENVKENDLITIDEFIMVLESFK